MDRALLAPVSGSEHMVLKPMFPAVFCTAAPIDFCGWKAVSLANGIVEAVVVPDIGGRIMAFTLGPYEYLWMNDRLAGRLFSPGENLGDGSLGAWKNYGGSKTWPAPQGWDREDQWHGPPDPVLDTGRYEVEELQAGGAGATVCVRSADDPRTGVRILRRLTLFPGGTHARLHLEMKNSSTKSQTWSLWDVVQLDAEGTGSDGANAHNDQAWLYVPTSPSSRFPSGYKVLFGPQDNPQWLASVRPGLLGARYQYRVGKIGVDSPAGWLAFVNQSLDFTFCQRFTYFEDATYPDDGATVECWTTGLGEAIDGLDYGSDPLYHLEAEVLGPLRTMGPGDTQSLDIEWYAARCPGPVIDVTSIGCCHRPLETTLLGDSIRLCGVFGAFFVGQLHLAWLDEAGKAIASEELGLASPLDVIAIDVLREAPLGARTAQLRIVNPDGLSLGVLGQSTV